MLDEKEKFDEIIGAPFEIEGYPDYIITIDPHRVIALIDLIKYSKELKWKPFITKGLPEIGSLYVDDVCFNAEYIGQAIEVLEPKEYAIDVKTDAKADRESNVLVLKNGNYGIMIAPAYPKEDEEDKKELDKYIKEPPKSVFVL